MLIKIFCVVTELNTLFCYKVRIFVVILVIIVYVTFSQQYKNGDHINLIFIKKKLLKLH